MANRPAGAKGYCILRKKNLSVDGWFVRPPEIGEIFQVFDDAGRRVLATSRIEALTRPTEKSAQFSTLTGSVYKFDITDTKVGLEGYFPAGVNREP